MSDLVNKLTMVSISLFVTVLVTACGGGGGDGTTPTLSDSYTGSRTLATVSNNSAETIAVEAYNGTETANGVSGLVNSVGGGAPAAASPAAATSRAVSNALYRATQTTSAQGTCGGSASYTATVNEQTGDFSMTFTFNSFCEPDGLTENVLNGSMTFSGNIDPTTQEMNHMTVSFGAITSTLSDGSEDITLTGSISMTMSNTNTGTVTMNFVSRDNLTGKTYWVDNYVATSTDNGTYEEVTLSGRFYDHDNGYVEITTITPGIIYTGDQHPSTGILQFDGANNNSIRLTFLTNTTYQVTAELNGDGQYDDIVPEVKTWQ